MSLTDHLLFNRKTTLPTGSQRSCLAEEYIDAKRPPPPVIKIVKTACYAHFKKNKADNIEAIINALKAGHNTQRAVMKATRLSKGTISNRLTQLAAGDEVVVDKSKSPWTYQLAEEEE